VNSAAGSGLQYRVLAKTSDTGSGTMVIAVPLSDVAQTLTRLRNVEAIVIAAVLAALAAFAWLLIRLGLRPLDRMGTTARAIAAGDLSRRVSPAETRTEVGRLGLALNTMLGQIEQAFTERQASEERLRRFLSDASHELRTPLTSIRGYAELFRMGAATSPEDTRKAMARIEEEATRMGVLVEDLLALARLDEMPQTRHEPVDLAPLLHDAAGDARAAARDREVTVTVEGEHLVTGDSSQLRQVLANLTRNALTHTPAGSPIELSVSSSDGWVRLAVRDHGPGLPDGAGDSVFERFWRTEGGRGRGKAGAGLGLAIVAAIVDAHDGRVSARNAPGGGASFEIELPRRLGADAPAPG
jgi:two-component system, OmpR family, sensor kinase